MTRGGHTAALLLLVLSWSLAAAAQQVPLPTWARSVETIDDGVMVFLRAAEDAPRRGTIERGMRVPLLGQARGSGCGDGRFIRVAKDAFVCRRYVQLSAGAPRALPLPEVPVSKLLPHDYRVVVSDGTRAYLRPADYHTDEYHEAFVQGFAVKVVEQRIYDGLSFVRTEGGLYLLEESLKPAAPSPFMGAQLSADELGQLGWVRNGGVPIRERPGGALLRRAARFERLRIAGEAARHTLRLHDGGFIDARQVVRPRPRQPPAGSGPRERWLDVDLSQQVLTAYEGARALFSTMISSGMPRSPTPAGEHRIWVKLTESDMNNTELQDVERNYSIEAVPWVQYFAEGIGFHAAFWHDQYGAPHSRGCVNLSPRDARWLFDFTGPHLPDGWSAILSTPGDPGTRVLVRH